MLGVNIDNAKHKNTEIPWLQQIPERWGVTRSKNLYRNVSREIRPEDDVITCFRDGTVTLRKNRRVTGFTESIKEIGYKGIRKGDLVIHVMDAFAGAVGVSDSDGKGSPVYSVCTAKTDLNNKYYAYLLREMARRGYIKALYRGIRERSSDFRFEVFGNLLMPLPPKAEQDQIVRFLDSKLAKINKFIRNKNRLIELLREQRQAVMNQAVTKGLDPDVKMKPSGVEWLGDVPEGWEVVRLKNCCSINPSIANKLKGHSLEDEVVFLPMEKISVYGDVDDTETRKIGEVRTGFTGFAKGDVVVAKITPCFENGKGACLNRIKTAIGFGTTELIVLRAHENVRPEYLYYITRSDHFRISGAEFMTGSAGQKRVPVAFIEQFRIGLPNCDMQAIIINHIEAYQLTIAQTIDRINKEIDLITEYRTSLISAVVTGKVDVRGIDVEEPPAEDLVDPDLDDIEDEELREDDLLESEVG